MCFDPIPVETIPPSTPRPSSPERVFSGLEPLTAAFSVGGTVALGAMAATVVPGWAFGWLALATMAAAGLLAGARYRLRISPAGVELVFLRAWILPLRRARFLTDAKISIYQSLEADRPEGLCVSPAVLWSSEARESDCFGPSDEARIERLRQAASEALAEARQAIGPSPASLRNDLLELQVDGLDLGAAKRDPWGRIRSVTSHGSIRLGVVDVPAGSTFELNGEDYVDPAREDVLLAVVLGRPTPLAQGLLVPAGSRLRVGRDGRVTSVHCDLGPSVVIDGWTVDGTRPLSWDGAGRLVGFTLATEAEVGGWRMPAGSSFHDSPAIGPLARRWVCHLGGALRLVDLELDAGDFVYFSPERDRLVAAGPARDVSVGDAVISGDRVPIPLTRDGAIDRDTCQRLGLLRAK